MIEAKFCTNQLQTSSREPVMLVDVNDDALQWHTQPSSRKHSFLIGSRVASQRKKTSSKLKRKKYIINYKCGKPETFKISQQIRNATCVLRKSARLENLNAHELDEDGAPK
ncbi:hypothetical protein HELRODRAFT_183870 [Helobdella robusta]|uniref:Uncharacterized protein n=1 Tax=Helobdella robusta TaxID=6412 RepID=T1FKA0_HELRO|nr:hypothetical protein HELRODRAFT_183870 [Helobdella robusta]ESO09775.1 hypothetical protein HELRODRAFT_183870 [Helobdella robusta]